MQSWRVDLRNWADKWSNHYAERPGILGVILGGSLARGQEWLHSDMEMGILMENRDPQIPYFNIHDGRGVEAIQLVKQELSTQMDSVSAGDLDPLRKWPIQLWKGRIIHDPTGLLAQFKRLFDLNLFNPQVVKMRIKDLQERIGNSIDEANKLLMAERPASALVRLRGAMNDAIQAFYWAHGELPRSQNRTDSRLHGASKKYSAAPFYRLYREVFDLERCNQVIKKTWPHVRDQVLEITALWGESARDFFDYAVDSHFAWRQNAGILTVYRLYVPIIGGEEHGLFNKLDDAAWVRENPLLVSFLGLDGVDQASVAGWAQQIAQASASLR